MRAEATTLTVSDAVSDPELRQLITRMPLWRRPGYLVRRQRGALDRRTFVTWLTPEGERLTKAMLGAMRRAQDRLLAPLDAAERESFMALLLRLIDANNDVSRAALGPARIDRAA